ncbi:helix-turn-helix transcriptional regulator [Nocardioides ochotonae]|uniref:helix-turn-helix transcriptional regulator n=1 Tax=Nocardioides ochotonae TaxID=2685869 RepID=UPI001409CFA3|nr:LuxR C-terminal-related transcriptional regulator [Nocardioides ochotonae]
MPNLQQQPRRRTRVVILEDHHLFAESLEVALSIDGYDVRRVGVNDVASAAAAISAVSRLRPRILLLDLDLGPLGDAVRLITPMAKEGINVVVVTASDDHARWGECVANGARRVVSKTRPLNEVLSVVRRLSQGLQVQDPQEREELLKAWRDQRASQQDVRGRLNSLTPRERQVLGHLIAGHQVREIARIGVISEATVRTQVKSILSKLGVSSQLAAVGMANSVGWRVDA